MKAFARLALAATLAACGGSDSNGTSSGDPGTDAGADAPKVPGVPDNTFTLTIDDPAAIRSIVQTQSTELKVHIKRGSGIGPISISVNGLPKDAAALPLSLDGNTTDATLKITTSSTTPQGPTKFSVIAKATTTAAPDATVEIPAFVRGAPGALDTTFASGGILATPFPTKGDGYQGTVFADGSVLLGFPLTRITPDGVIDTTYGTGGHAVESYSQSSMFMAVDAQRRAFLLGPSTSFRSTLHRTNADGTNDTTVNVNLLVDVVGMTMATDGKLKLLTHFAKGVSTPYPGGITVVSYTGDAQADNGGFATIRPADVGGAGGNAADINAWSIGTANDGNVVVTGNLNDGAGQGSGHDTPFFAVVAPNGAILIKQKIAISYPIVKMSMVPDRTAFLVSYLDGTQRPTWARVKLDGTVSGPFPSFGGEVGPVAEQADGKVLLGGQVGSFASTDFSLARHNADGTVDTTFGNAGRVTTRIGDGSNLSPMYGIQIAPDGRIYAIGSHFDVEQGAVIRYWN